MTNPEWMPVAIFSLITVAVLVGGAVFLDVWKQKVGRGIQENVRNFGTGLLLVVAAIGGVSYWLSGRQEARETQEVLRSIERSHVQEQDRQRADESLKEMNRHNEEVAARQRKKFHDDMKRTTDQLDALAKENQQRLDELRRSNRGR